MAYQKLLENCHLTASVCSLRKRTKLLKMFCAIDRLGQERSKPARSNKKKEICQNSLNSSRTTKIIIFHFYIYFK